MSEEFEIMGRRIRERIDRERSPYSEIEVLGTRIPREALNQGIRTMGLGVFALITSGEFDFHCSMAAPVQLSKRKSNTSAIK